MTPGRWRAHVARARAIAAACAALSVACVAPTALAAQSVAPWPTNGWATATPAAQQLNATPWVVLDSAIRAGRYGNVDQLLVIRRGYKLLDFNYPRDYRVVSAGRRSPIGCGPGACTGFTAASGFNYFDPNEHPFYRNGHLHNLQSASKSVIATVLGAAMQQGRIASLDTPLLSHLRAYADVKTDARLAKATLADLLTMRTGIEWHEQDRPLDSTNTTVQLEASADWVRFTLGQPMDAEPGAKWAYNSGGSHLISAVIHDATNTTADVYARAHLFGPLGIREFHWKYGGGGLPDGESGVYLTAESLAKIGYLYLRGGEWDGRRILPAEFARAATSRVVGTGVPGGRGYGYQWWRVDQSGLEIWAAMGFGGQYLLIVPSADLIVVTLGWNVYGDRVPGILGPVLQAIVNSIAG